MGCCSSQPKKGHSKLDSSRYLSAQQIENLTELFKRYATNDILRYSQFTQVFSKTQNFPEGVKTSAYTAFCSEGEKSINQSSFMVTLCRVLRSNRKASLEFLFKVFDVDRDKELSAQEFSVFATHMISEPYLELEQGPYSLAKFTKEMRKLKEFDNLLSPFALVPTIEGERESFRRYQSALNSYTEGTERWLIAAHWLNAWKAFTDEQPDKVIKPPIPPGHIDNYYLHMPNSRNLKPDLEEHKDYELLTKKAWTELYKQYAGGPEICRKYVELEGKMMLELHPPIMVFYRPYVNTEKADPNTLKKIVFSCVNTLEEAVNKYRTDTGLQHQCTVKRSSDKKVWEFLSDMSVTLYELKPTQEDCFLVIPLQRDQGKKISLQGLALSGSSFSTNGISQGSARSGSPTSRHQFASFKKMTQGPGQVGLVNLGQTCYMNCVLQCVAHIFPFRSVLLDDQLNVKPFPEDTSKLMKTLAQLFFELWQGAKPHISPLNFAKAFKNRNSRFDAGEQHDSHDFLAMLLDNLNEDLKPNKEMEKPNAELTNAEEDEVQELGNEYWNFVKENGSTVSNICSGLTKIKLTCKNCSQDKVKFEEVLYLSVACEGFSGASVTLNECLRQHFSEDKFKANCEQCQADVQHSMRIRLYNAPQVLIICLKRFSAKSGRVSKINKAVDFPSTGLDLSKLVVGRTPSLYDLVAVVNHFGDIHQGHYTAACKNDKHWVYFDDDFVTMTTEDTSQWAQSGYILFYQLRS
mmetsp:Transcript_8924/g.17246  ORF Transcript_8924/g.17246 Transcript_8924/m.17246 type:complete len:747 (-) Transcript_8924:789-3029(-)